MATQSKEIELHTAAIDALGECGVHGKDFLVMIVESAAEDQLRERAMTAHLRLHDKGDLDWYKQLYKPKRTTRRQEGGEPAPKPPKKDPEEGQGRGRPRRTRTPSTRRGRPIEPAPLHGLRGARVEHDARDELVEATKDGYQIRYTALGTQTGIRDERRAK